MNRTSVTHLRTLVDQLNDLVGKPINPYTRDDDGQLRSVPGCYVLDCAYGGYRLAQMANETGGERNITPRYRAGMAADLIRTYTDGLRARD